MKVRFIQKGGFWYGQVYGDWNCLLLNYKWTGWWSVTSGSFTKLGAKYELKKWINKNCPQEFEI